ncbi:MAG: GGDEF domain-containing protein [Bacillales bacterium]|jgi:diguanylate cyclase (GGDEF)-like protein|nr:GGDEF domain-containing protein [Bacillales bacterium]
MGNVLAIKEWVSDNVLLFFIIYLAIFLLSIFLVINFSHKKSVASREHAYLSSKYYVLAELTKELFFEYDVRNDVFEASKGFATIFNIEKSLLNFSKALVEANLLNILQIIQKIIQEKKEYLNNEFVYLDAESDKITKYTLTATALYDPSGKPITVLGKLANIQGIVEKKSNDSLTGLLNRSMFEETVETLHGKHHPECLLFFDLDNLKEVNDNFGHSTGDEFILLLAKALNNNFKKNAVIGRFGGDEFIVFGYGQPYAFFRTAVLNVLEDMTVGLIKNDKMIRTTVSIGGRFTELTIPYKDMFESADSALYRIKYSSKNNYFIVK